MIILFGMRTMVLIMGNTILYTCTKCNNANPFLIVRKRQWFTLFFIPICPLKTNYYLTCPICNLSYPITKQDAENHLSGTDVAP